MATNEQPVAPALSRTPRRRRVPVPTTETLSKAQAAGLAHTSIRTIERWIAEGHFAASRPIARGSSRVLIDAASFRRWIGLAMVGGAA